MAAAWAAVSAAALAVLPLAPAAELAGALAVLAAGCWTYGVRPRPDYRRINARERELGWPESRPVRRGRRG